MKKTILGLLVTAALLINACEITSIDDDTEGITSEVEDLIAKDAVMESIIAEADYEVDYFSGSDAAIRQASVGSIEKSGFLFPYGGRYMIGQCPNVTVDTLPGRFPLTITLDYGDSTVLNNGRVISGIIIIEVSAPPRTDGATRQIRYQHFAIDSIGIEGHATCEFRRGDSTDNGKFICNREMTFSFPDSTHIVRTENRIRNWISGLGTPFDPFDDEIHITGNANCIGSEGNVYSKVITRRLVKNGQCRFITEGTVEFRVNGHLFGVLDYGNGTCDNVATMSRNGETKEIRIGRYTRRNRPQ